MKVENIYIYNGIALRYDEPGNIMFGYVGSQLFDLLTLRFGAGVYQQMSGTSDAEWSKLWPNWGDDPVDSNAIKYGYMLRKAKDISLEWLGRYIELKVFEKEFRKMHEQANQ